MMCVASSLCTKSRIKCNLLNKQYKEEYALQIERKLLVDWKNYCGISITKNQIPQVAFSFLGQKSLTQMNLISDPHIFLSHPHTRYRPIRDLLVILPFLQ